MTRAEAHAELVGVDELGRKILVSLNAEMAAAEAAAPSDCPHCVTGGRGVLCEMHSCSDEECAECGALDEDADEETT